jgi:glycine cleavage system protein P-like pyridoxal-binding family
VHARGAVQRQGFAEGLSTLDVAKALIDEGFHPMTVYFPLVVHGAMLVEPTETESKAALDQFIAALRSIAERANGDESLKAAPHLRAAPAARRDAGGAQAQAGGIHTAAMRFGCSRRRSAMRPSRRTASTRQRFRTRK